MQNMGNLLLSSSPGSWVEVCVAGLQARAGQHQGSGVQAFLENSIAEFSAVTHPSNDVFDDVFLRTGREGLRIAALPGERSFAALRMTVSGRPLGASLPVEMTPTFHMKHDRAPGNKILRGGDYYSL
jgi:hypothetical protein